VLSHSVFAHKEAENKRSKNYNSTNYYNNRNKIGKKYTLSRRDLVYKPNYNLYFEKLVKYILNTKNF